MNNPDHSKFIALELQAMREGIIELEECLEGLQDVQAGLNLVLKLHGSICADEEEAFFNVLDILSSTLKARIEHGMDMIP
jgi:hypothetical protein